MTLHFKIMVKVQAGQAGRVVFITFPSANDAKKYLTQMKDKERKLKEALDVMAAQVEILRNSNQKLQEYNESLQTALEEATTELGILYGIEPPSEKDIADNLPEEDEF